MPYADIVAVDRPDSAEPKTTVTVKPYVKNTWYDYLYASVTGKFNNTIFYLYPAYQSIAPGETYIFSGSFTMPDKNIRVYFWSYYWTGTEWYLDDEAYVDISKGVWIALAQTNVPIKASIVSLWIALAQTTTLIKYSIVALWVELAQVIIPIKAIPHNWIMLNETSVSIKAGPSVKKEWLPWVTGAGAIGLAIYAVTRKD